MAKYLDEAGAEQLNQLLAAKFDTKIDKPISKTYEGIQGSGDNNHANYAFYYMSVRPNSYTSTWILKYRIHVWIPGQTNYDAYSDVVFMGDQASLNSYAILNHIYNTSYRPVYYHAMYRLTSAGYNAGYGHAIAMSMADSNERTTSGYARNFTVEIIDTIGCTVEFLDTPVLWANWPGTGSTNYGSIATYNFASNGLQEVGDNDTTYVLSEYYQRTVAGIGGVHGYNLVTYDTDNKLQCFVNKYTNANPYSVNTDKTKNTASFQMGAPIYYYNTSTEIAAGSYCADATLRQATQYFDLRYSTNCAKTLTSNLPVYLVGIPNGSTYTLADTWWTQTLPTTADGKIYIYLGTSLSSYQIGWCPIHPIYWYKDGALQIYQVPVTSSDVTTALGYTPYSAANPNGYTSNTGTITKVQANGTDVASSGTANIPAATTSKYGVTELSSATNSTSEVLAATPKAVKAAYDLAASKGTGTITGVSVNGTSVATSGVANITSVPASILSGAIPSAVTATTQTQGDNSTKIATTAYVDAAIDNLPDPMIFKGSLGTGGTITALPVDGSANIGDTYKVITAGTYASKAAKVGDTFICLTKTSSANTWELIPSGDEPAGTVTSVTIKATSPISIDSSAAITSSGTRTLSHANSGVTAGNYKSVTVNATGHVTAGENPTTLAGFGITDAKIASGVITLGSNTITPLTSASTLDATKLSGTIPSGCYTDTKNTAGSTDSSSKLFLIGATSQAVNPQTYSQDTAYVGTDGKLYSNSKEVVNLSDTQALTNKTYNGYTLAAASAKAVDTSISAGSSSANLPTSAAVATFVEGKGYVTTDTKNTAGSTDTSSKIYLIGATSQAANPQTYSDNEVYVTSGAMTAKSYSLGTYATMEYNSTDNCIEFNFS